MKKKTVKVRKARIKGNTDGILTDKLFCCSEYFPPTSCCQLIPVPVKVLCLQFYFQLRKTGHSCSASCGRAFFFSPKQSVHVTLQKAICKWLPFSHVYLFNLIDIF